MSTNDGHLYSRPRRLGKDSYELVGPPAIPPKTKSLKTYSAVDNTAAALKSPTMDHSTRIPSPAPPVPTSARPTTRTSVTTGSGASVTGPPPLPPRMVGQNQYSSPKGQALLSQNSLIYNIPSSVQCGTPPPSYDTLPPNKVQPSDKGSTRLNAPSLVKAKPVSRTSSDKPASPSNSMNLRTLVENHQNYFPLRVEVTAGYFGETDRDTFSEGDMLNVHFAKQVTVVVVDYGGGKVMRIPLNSTLQFSPLYDPQSNFKEAKKGFEFKTIKEVITASASKMPLMVHAKRSHKNMTPTHSVEKGDLLKIVEIKHGKFGGQSLICQLLNGKQGTKRLSESCHGEFSTDPESLKLYLAEFTTYFSLPQIAVPFINYVEHRDLPLAESDIVTIVRVETEKTVLATPLLDEKDSETYGVGKPVTFDIPISLDVLEVQIVEESDDYEKLYADTREMMENFDPTKKENQIRVGEAESIYYCDVRDDQRTAGIELIAKESIYQDTSSLLTMRKGFQKPESDEYCYTDRRSLMSIGSPITHKESTLMIPRPFDGSTKSIDKSGTGSLTEEYCEMNHRDSQRSSPMIPIEQPLLDSQSYQMHEIIEKMRTSQHLDDMDGIQLEMNHLKRQVDSMTDHIKKVEQGNASLKAAVQELQQKVNDLGKSQTGNYVELVPSSDKSISTFTCNQLLDFLEKANMSKYKEIFQKEQIDGPLLAHLDEDILEKELGITSKLHRKKLILHSH